MYSPLLRERFSMLRMEAPIEQPIQETSLGLKLQETNPKSVTYYPALSLHLNLPAWGSCQCDLWSDSWSISAFPLPSRILQPKQCSCRQLLDNFQGCLKEQWGGHEQCWLLLVQGCHRRMKKLICLGSIWFDACFLVGLSRYCLRGLSCSIDSWFAHWSPLPWSPSVHQEEVIC